MTEAIRVLLADDHPIVRHGLRQIVEADAALAVVAEANNGAEALALIEQHEPGVAVIDVTMPDMDGFAVVRALRKWKRAPEIIFLTMHSEPEYFECALELGVKGYVLKDTAVGEIVGAIKSVAAAKPFLSPALSGQLLQRRREFEQREEMHPGLAQLTDMERRILKLVARDLSSKEIGTTLSISPRTVEKHRTNICSKLKVHGTFALARFALTHRDQL